MATRPAATARPRVQSRIRLARLARAASLGRAGARELAGFGRLGVDESELFVDARDTAGGGALLAMDRPRR
jgi:hypothetical protein